VSETAAAAGPWRTVTVVGIRNETAHAKTFRLRFDEPAHHLAGQHYVLRLTAPDGYTASRSYSIASAPDASTDFELTVERLDEGEVSTFLHDEAMAGDTLEVRGPIGGWFVWHGDGPALLVGGGSGVVPLMAMLRLARRRGTSGLLQLLVSVRRREDLYYADEIVGPETTIAYTREAPAGSGRGPGRVHASDITSLLERAPAAGVAYICGSSGFADSASELLVGAGFATDAIRVERFGPTRPFP
jgi:ferredoxin-NADP reductase